MKLNKKVFSETIDEMYPFLIEIVLRVIELLLLVGAKYVFAIYLLEFSSGVVPSVV